jgi:NDP-sugar pyrophosphorylase family protein
MNGDILTEVDFKAMQAFHREHRAALTVAVRQFEFQVPYGVVEGEGPIVREVKEKPTHRHFVNAGIYLVEPAAHALVPRGKRFDMTDLIRVLIERKLRVVSFPVWEYWRDIGQHEDYVKAQADIKDGMVSP